MILIQSECVVSVIYKEKNSFANDLPASASKGHETVSVPADVRRSNSIVFRRESQSLCF